MPNSDQVSTKLRNQAVAWLLRLQSEQCTDAERRAFAAWLAADSSNRSAYERVRQQVSWMEALKHMPFRARHEALQYRRKTVARPLFAYATVAVLLLAAGLATFSPNGWYGTSQTYSTPIGVKQTIALGDGSVLELNTGSTVRVHFNRWRRSVELQRGEAFFNVVHNDQRPFEVSAGNALIRDIGTAFEVYQQPDKVVVAVQDGIVETHTAKGKRTLHGGQQIAYDANGAYIGVASGDIAMLTAWRTGKLIFKGRRLGEVLAEVSRYHDVSIRLQDQSLADLSISGVFRTERLDAILDAVAAILPVKVKRINAQDIIIESLKSG